MQNQIFHSQRPDKPGLGEAGRSSWAQTEGVKTPESLNWGWRKKGADERALNVGLSVGPYPPSVLGDFKVWNSKWWPWEPGVGMRPTWKILPLNRTRWKFLCK